MPADAETAVGNAAADPADGVAAPPPRVLSMQSHVVSGYVGNKVAAFPLQLLGYEVDVLNTVQLSNHTGKWRKTRSQRRKERRKADWQSHDLWDNHPCFLTSAAEGDAKFAGQRLSAKDMGDLLAGLKVNGLDAWSHALTGYVGSAEVLRETAAAVRRLKVTQEESLFYVCDPVMGDTGGLYVPEAVVPVYRDELLPLADVITPNQFEAEILTGLTIRTVRDLVVAADRLHALGPRYVVITSSVLGEDCDCTTFAASMTLMASTALRPPREAAPSSARCERNSTVDRY
ncbi:MAG: Ribokinase-like protein, partial [Olpidium bornovanus]